jgi:glycosyltransferase involved in cell wall biosynthesis
MPAPLTTIAFVPREQFSTTEQSLETLYRRTDSSFELICVDGGSPPAVRSYLERAARTYRFTLLRTDEYLTPNQARNLALPYVKTPHVVFVDNDILVAPGWLEPLVACAEETGAWLVGPLYFEFLPECDRIHMAGGECRIEELESCGRNYVEIHHFAHQRLADVRDPLVRHETELVEFHTMLVAMDVFRRLGPLDEGYLCNAEHADLCLLVREAGGHVFLEPRSRVTYAPPRRLEGADLEFFRLRWSEAWAVATNRHLQQKWKVADFSPGLAWSMRWVAQHRRFSLHRWGAMRRMLGARWAARIERRLIEPLEAAANRRLFPPQIFGTPPKPQCRLVYEPTGDRGDGSRGS